MFNVLLSEEDYDRTTDLMMTTLGFRLVKKKGNRFRYESGEGGIGTYVDLLCQPSGHSGQMGVGAVHHVV